MRQMHWMIVAEIGALLAGCGGGRGSSAGGAGAPQDPVFLVGLTINPASATLDLDETLVFSAVGLYSDGSTAPVNALWGSSNAAVVALDRLDGASVVATAVAPGYAWVGAAYQGLIASAAIKVGLGVVYGGLTGDGGVVRYSPGGGVPATVFRTEAVLPLLDGRGLVLNRTGDLLYAMGITDGGSPVWRIDPATGSGEIMATFPSPCFGLDCDSQDRICTQNFEDGGIYRLDPVTGNIETLTGNTGGGMLDLAVGPDDSLYFCPLLFGAGGPWIVRRNPTTGVIGAWGVSPASIGGASGMGLAIGLAINRNAEAFIGDTSGPEVYRLVDVNGDGDALDPGEMGVYGSIPGNVDDHMIFGLSVASGSTLLVNVKPWNRTDDVGIYWLVDGNGDGEVDSELYNPNYVSNGWDGGCIAAPR